MNPYLMKFGTYDCTSYYFHHIRDRTVNIFNVVSYYYKLVIKNNNLDISYESY